MKPRQFVLEVTMFVMLLLAGCKVAQPPADRFAASEAPADSVAPAVDAGVDAGLEPDSPAAGTDEDAFPLDDSLTDDAFADPDVVAQDTGDCPEGTACEDGKPCTENDTCHGGVCKAGTQKGCDDGEPCTNDGCDPTSGDCTYIKIVKCGGSCNSAGDCPTGSDPCVAAACTGGKCGIANTTAPCSDNNPCTQADTCQGGVCQPGPNMNCDDSKACTADSCDPGTGTCTHVSSDSPCTDNNPCTVGDTCGGGTCQPGGAKLCSDGNLCTVDDCGATESASCTHSSNTATCEDGNKCTGPDLCANTVCKPGSLKTCDDNNPCTADSCSPTTGCSNLAGQQQGPCSNPKQGCVAGQCANLPSCGNGKCESYPNGAETTTNCGADCTGHYCDTHCGKLGASGGATGCSCSASCKQSLGGDCCNEDGTTPSPKMYGCGPSTTCGDCYTPY